jgi:hypothetical protein
MKLKKPKKTTLRNKCDAKVGADVRSLGYCEICGRKEELQWVHFISRGVIKLRYHKKNNACICAGCHFKGHSNPKWFTIQWDKIKGRGTTSWLNRESNILKPIEISFYEKILCRKT